MTGNQGDDTDEPWDEGASIKSSPLTACVQEYLGPTNKEDNLDDGELPALSLGQSKRSPSLLNGKTPTTKPLQPPSKAGLSPENRQDSERQNRDQMSPTTRRGSKWDDDMPDDEVMMGIDAKPREMSPQSHEAEQHSVNGGILKKSNSDEHNVCDYTYLMDICGNGENSNASPARKAKVNLKSISDITSDCNVTGTEEQTAIEVEYVEPPKQNKAWSPEKKNSYLAAMARKAKADFKKAAPEGAASNSPEDIISTNESAQEDIYSSFNATEKRKFLKMVNSGIPPTESAKKVLEEREGSATSSKRSLAFWKRSKDGGPVSPRSTKFLEPQASPGGGARDDVRELKSRDVAIVPDQANGEEPNDRNALGVESDDDSVDGSIENGSPKKSHDNAIVAGAVAAGATAAVATSVFAASKDGNNEPDILNKFEKSGKSYYDAVSRDPGVVEFIDDDMDVNPTTNSKEMRPARAPAIRNPKLKGFAALNEPENSKKNTANSDDTNNSKSMTRNARRGKGAKQAGSSPDGSRRRFRLLGNRAAKFESLNESDAEEEKSSTRSTPIAAAVIGAAAVGATAVAMSGNASESDKNTSATPERSVKKQESGGEKTVEQLEKELLRPLGNVQEDEVQDTEQAYGNTPPHISEVSNGRAVAVAEDNTDLENYLDSTSSVYANTNDQMSVISGRSHWTAGTMGTNITTSSRSRRPGAAKQRLAQARKADYSTAAKKGWHDSMKNAAASSNQSWDPTKGFEGYEYKDQNEDIAIDSASDEPIRVNLDGIRKSKERESNAIDADNVTKQPVVVPFPESWEKDRHQMINGSDQASDEIVARTVADPLEGERGEEEPNEWQKSMKAASENLEKEGASWNPETGWQVENKNDDENLTETNDTIVMASEAEDNTTSDPEGVSPAGAALGVGAGVAAAMYFMGEEQSSNAPPAALEGGDQSSATSGSSLNDENYVQLGDTGSVRAFSSSKEESDARNRDKGSRIGASSSNPILEDVNEEDTSHLLNSRDVFTNADEGAEVVQVVKQKNDEGDKNLFVHDSRNTYTNAETSKSRRRGPGPVDIDEIDDMDFDDEDDDEDGEMWASNQIKARDSVAPSSPPKLAASRRDTSLNRDRRVRSSINSPPHSEVGVSPERHKMQPSPISNVSDASQNSSSVKLLAQQWESGKKFSSSDERDQGTQNPATEPPPGSMEWKSFLGKKVRAESAAAAAIQPRTLADEHGSNENALESEDDSLFEFAGSAGEQSGAFPTGVPPLLEQSDKGQEEEVATRQMDQVSDTGTNIEQGSFMKRLQACAAPMLPRQLSGQGIDNGESVNSEHLAFLRSKPQDTDGENFPQSLCARPGTISDESVPLDLQLHKKDTENSLDQSRSSSAKRGKQQSSENFVGSEVRSVISEEGFGTKTSYLESLDMKAAVANPKRSGSRGRGSEGQQRSSAASDVSISSRKSERWQEFLERKASGGSPNKLRQEGGSDIQDNISRASERYAAEKVELMMAAMSASKEGDREAKMERILDSEIHTPDTSLEMSHERSDVSKVGRSSKVKNESARAAEELAAARVEAMMAAMTSQTLDEGEI